MNAKGKHEGFKPVFRHLTGGLDIAASWAGIETALFCEIEPYACEILKRRWPNVPIHNDVRTLTGDALRGIDLIHGGFPCQDVSVAGKRTGFVNADGETTRSGLWGEMCRIIGEARPRWIVAENVRGLLSIPSPDGRHGGGFGTVLRDLAGLGYRVGWTCHGADDAGAPHRRDRVFILGVRADVTDGLRSRGPVGLPGPLQGEEGNATEPLNDGSPSGGLWPTPTVGTSGGGKICGGSGHWEMLKAGVGIEMARKMGAGNGGQLNPDWVECLMGYPLGWTDVDCDEPGPWPGWPALMGEAQYPYEPPRTVTGCRNRAKRLKCLGNSVVPQQAYPLFRAIAEMEAMTP